MNSKFLMAMLTLAGAVSAFAGDATPAKSDSEVAGIDAAKLWTQTCAQCHNMRPVKAYSAAEWGVIVHHMRVRANLTGQEARAIAAFLQSSGQ